MSKMPIGIAVEENGSLSFGDYTQKDKIKVNDFEHMSNVYSLRSHDLVTRLEKNGEMLLESVPGTAIRNFAMDEAGFSFEIAGATNVQITMGLAPEATYHLRVTSEAGGEVSEEISANRSGKLSFGVELAHGGARKKVALEKL